MWLALDKLSNLNGYLCGGFMLRLCRRVLFLVGVATYSLLNGQFCHHIGEKFSDNLIQELIRELEQDLPLVELTGPGARDFLLAAREYITDHNDAYEHRFVEAIDRLIPLFPVEEGPSDNIIKVAEKETKRTSLETAVTTITTSSLVEPEEEVSPGNKFISSDDVYAREQSYIDVRGDANYEHINEHLITSYLRDCKDDEMRERYRSILTRNLPRVTCAASGGGLRAMAGIYSFLLGLQKADEQMRALFDAVEYLSLLSGSSWFMLFWLAQQKSLAEMEEPLRALFRSMSGRSLSQELWRQICEKRQFTVGENYMMFLEKILFSSGDERTSSFSDCHNFLRENNIPYPIFSAIFDDKTGNQPWLESTPHVVGLPYYDKWIPENLFGRSFSSGVVQQHPERQIMQHRHSFYAGIFGSAFGVSVEEALGHVFYQSPSLFQQGLMQVNRCANWLNKNYLVPAMRQVVTEENFTYFYTNVRKISDSRPFAITVNNFLQNDPIVPEVMNNDLVTIFDAGIVSNIPLNPLLHRNPSHLIILFDVTQDRAGDHFQGFQSAYRLAIAQGYKLPMPDDLNPLRKNGVTLLHDDLDSTVPVVLYVNVWKPHINTLDVTADDFNDIQTSVEQLIQDNRAIILEGYYRACDNIIIQHFSE